MKRSLNCKDVDASWRKIEKLKGELFDECFDLLLGAGVLSGEHLGPDGYFRVSKSHVLALVDGVFMHYRALDGQLPLDQYPMPKACAGTYLNEQ
jgi:hypothetical protein